MELLLLLCHNDYHSYDSNSVRQLSYLIKLLTNFSIFFTSAAASDLYWKSAINICNRHERYISCVGIEPHIERQKVLKLAET